MMTETISDVFDVAYPSPPTLQQISSITVALELWRNGIRSYHLQNSQLSGFHLKYCEGTLLKVKGGLPDLPQRIYNILKESIVTFGNSISQWLDYHWNKVFRWCYGVHYCFILSLFHDFAWDWNGTIHYVHTAKRMLSCDEICNEQKFRIACLYCFKDDIKRIWPSVSPMLRLFECPFSRFPELHYWICDLENALVEVTGHVNETIEKIMLKECGPNNYTCAEYFWNRMLKERNLRALIKLNTSAWELFARYILQRLSEPQLENFFTGSYAGDLLSSLVIQGNTATKKLVLPTWMFIKNKIDTNSFTRFTQESLWSETNHFSRDKHPDCTSTSPVHLGCEIWKSAAENLKKAALENVLPERMWFLILKTHRSTTCGEMRFLTTVLSDASFEERSTFWHKHWAILIVNANVEDVLEIMKLCFRNEEEIALFKEHMFQYENIKPYLIHMLEDGCVERANKFLSFCNSDARKRLELKQRFLELNWHNVDYCFFCINFITEDERVV